VTFLYLSLILGSHSSQSAGVGALRLDILVRRTDSLDCGSVCVVRSYRGCAEAGLGEVNDRDGGCVAFVLDILFLWALCNITPNIALGRAVSLRSFELSR
jgi:hypothetical protein